jgi:pyruvate/2-oxoglutarate dehydrogenase complex dihydrolipoamide acyltransferase (E2) component
MRYLEAKRLAEANGLRPSLEDKMMPGSRPEQQLRPSHIPRATAQPPIADNVVALAAKLGVDLRTVVGSGKDGAILARDVRESSVRAHAQENKSSESSDEEVSST